AGTGREKYLLAAAQERLSDRMEQAPRDLGCILAGDQSWKQDRELVSAGARKNLLLTVRKTRYHVGAAQTLVQSISGRLQQLIADVMTERIVDLLEAVEVDVHQGKHASLHRRALHDLDEAAHEYAA